jgi:hypothetical protein
MHGLSQSYILKKEVVINPMNEKSIIKTNDLEVDQLETVSGGSASGIPLPGVTKPACPICGSNESDTEFYPKDGKWYRRLKCLRCGAYFLEEEVIIPSGQVPQRPIW